MSEKLSHHIATKSTVALHVGTMWPLFVLSNYWCFISQVLMAMDCKQLSFAIHQIFQQLLTTVSVTILYIHDTVRIFDHGQRSLYTDMCMIFCLTNPLHKKKFSCENQEWLLLNTMKRIQKHKYRSSSSFKFLIDYPYARFNVSLPSILLHCCVLLLYNWAFF